MSRSGGGPVTAAILLALACALSGAAPGRAAAATAGRELAVRADGNIESDGVRFAWVTESIPGPWPGLVRVFDTLRGRSFRPAPPLPGCELADVGGGLALWHCPSRLRPLISNLATGRHRRPRGIRQILALNERHPGLYCGAQDHIGRFWMEIRCPTPIGPRPDPFFLNHRTGALTDEFLDADIGPSRLLDLDAPKLIPSPCAPLKRSTLFAYKPPFALEAKGWRWRREYVDRIRLRRCGQERAEIVSRCPWQDCRTPQLGSRYVTWGERRRIFAYLPRVRRRVLVGRAPSGFQELLSVAHTCDRVFSKWARRVYVARFRPREGAPPCQKRTRR